MSNSCFLLQNCIVLMSPKFDNFRVMATISTTRCLVSLSIWRNHLGQDYFDRNEIGLYKQTSLHVTHQVQASDPWGGRTPPGSAWRTSLWRWGGGNWERRLEVLILSSRVLEKKTFQSDWTTLCYRRWFPACAGDILLLLWHPWSCNLGKRRLYAGPNYRLDSCLIDHCE